MSQLIILTKYPTPWAVKTRLWVSIGMEQAAYVQRKCIEKLVETHMTSTVYDTHIMLRQSALKHTFCSEFGVDENVVSVQQWDDLGSIIAHAFAYWFAAGHHELIVIWSDTPLLSPLHIQMLLSPLKEWGKQLSVWPVQDGWYYAIGANDPSIQDVVQWMEYSHDQVLKQTLQRANEAWFTTRQTMPMRDCDTIEDLDWHVENDPSGRWRGVSDGVKSV
jgi:glycosyltransferase A (GT-A) superfamily protein (DUF2064 family)